MRDSRGVKKKCQVGQGFVSTRSSPRSSLSSRQSPQLTPDQIHRDSECVGKCVFQTFSLLWISAFCFYTQLPEEGKFFIFILIRVEGMRVQAAGKLLKSTDN